MKSNPFKNTLVTCLLSACISTPISADHLQWQDENHSYDQARRALDKGEILPLEQVIKHLRKYSADHIVSTEYEYEFDRWVYEFKLIDAQGRMSRVHIDAHQGNVIQVDDD